VPFAEALAAHRRGEDSAEAEAGGLLEAEFMATVIALGRAFSKKK
jgi:hypothetical protein